MLMPVRSVYWKTFGLVSLWYVWVVKKGDRKKYVLGCCA